MADRRLIHTDALGLLPASLEAEQALLGALLANNKALDRVPGLEAHHFADGVHGHIFTAIKRRIDAGRLADAVTMRKEMAQDAALDDVGGTAYLAQLLGAMVGIVNAGEYGKIIRDAWLRREIIGHCHTAIERARGADAQELAAGDILGALDADIAELSRDGATGDAPRDSGMVADQVMQGFQRAVERRGGLAGITSGYAGIDRMTGGFMPGQLILIGARPAMGKTALSAGIATRAAAAGARVLYISAEMLAQDVLARAAAAVADLPVTAALRAGFEDELGRWQSIEGNSHEAHRLAAAARRLKSLPLLWDDAARHTAASIRQKARAMRRRGGLDLIVVDYLGRLQPSQRAAGFRNRVIEIGELARDLKMLALELQVPVVLLSQLSRSLESRDDKRPVLSDLRDSGEIEQEADIVGFLYRAHYYLQSEKPVKKASEAGEKFDARLNEWATALAASVGRGEFIIAKQRQGPTGPVRLRFQDNRAWFFDDNAEGQPAIPGLPE
jgi:replicative DNA helicase